jgi:hypothetical protein
MQRRGCLSLSSLEGKLPQGRGDFNNSCNLLIWDHVHNEYVKETLSQVNDTTI